MSELHQNCVRANIAGRMTHGESKSACVSSAELVIQDGAEANRKRDLYA
jgi:hypothetical protein